MRSRGQLKITTLGSSSWMPYDPQGVKGNNDVYTIRDSACCKAIHTFIHEIHCQ